MNNNQRREGEPIIDTPRTNEIHAIINNSGGSESAAFADMLNHARQLERELDVYKSTLELIADHGGCTTTDDGLTCTGSWCAEQAKRALEETK